MNKANLIPLAVVSVVIATLVILYSMGVINFKDNNIYEINPPATRGVPCAYEFTELIPLINSNWNGELSGYTFYLGSGFGFPPMGLTLGIDGVLKGTPTGKGSKFQVCVKDVGGNSICKNYHLTVNSPDNNDGDDDNIYPNNCPATSSQTSTPCHSSQNGPAVVGVIVYDYCPCPSDTTYSGTTDVVTPGGPYKICTCK